MSKKPSLFVVERKEVVILAILFILSIVLTFTVGVKYGEIVGRKAAVEEITADEGLKEAKSNMGGALNDEAAHDSTAKVEQGKTKKIAEGAATDSKDINSAGEPEKKMEISAEAAAGINADQKSAANELSEMEEDSKKSAKGLVEVNGGGSAKDNDEELLNALKDAGIEKKSDGEVEPEAEEKSLPAEVVERTNDFAGPHFVIQVGSYPTKRDAERHLSRLKAQKLDPRILPSAETKNGRWFRVALGRYDDRNIAVQKARTFKRRGLIKDYFVRKVQ